MRSNVSLHAWPRAQATMAAAINRAVAKAHEQARAGNQPALLASEATPVATHQTWAVSSRTVAGTIYLVDLVADCRGVETRCDCEAQHAGRICWHRAAARLALFGKIAHHDARGWRHAGPEDLADRLGWWAQQPPALDPADPTAFAAVAWEGRTMTTSPLIITISDRGRRGIVLALTDRLVVYRRWRRRTATTACLQVYRLLARGHRLAFPSALRALEAEAGGELHRSTSPARSVQATD